MSDDPKTSTAKNREMMLAKAESMIDAFYAFDREHLARLLEKAGTARDQLLYYQGWAEGGNYRVLERRACVARGASEVVCAITVEDDPVLALGLDFKVTDTFTLRFDGLDIVDVTTDSNDPPIYYAARDWVKAHRPDIMAGPCAGMCAGGTTPGDCARAMTEAYAQYAASDDFPGSDDGLPTTETSD
ncbi:MAG: hypothetical protein AAF648_04610 [Pseudomonadota bacterium]